MFEDDRDRDRRKQSLLSLGATASEPYGVRSAGSIRAASGATNESDPALLHRMARSRREAAPSPLLSALAAMEGYRPEPAAQPPVEPEPAVEPGSRAGVFATFSHPG